MLDDPRVEVITDDARHFILTTQEQFDIITSDPIHPWVKGSAALYSLEYFELVKSRLNEGGVFTLYAGERDPLKSLLVHRTVRSVFLHVQLLHKLTPDHAVVMDCFLGSGTTMMAALRAGRSCVGAELSPAYCALILDRMREAGVVTLIGTDSGIPMKFHTQSTWNELDVWVRELGVSPMEAIRASSWTRRRGTGTSHRMPPPPSSGRRSRSTWSRSTWFCPALPVS